MRILTVTERTVDIGSPSANAAIAFGGMTASALAIVTDRVIDGERVIGYAFDSIGRYGKGGILRDRFIPRLLAAEPAALVDAQGLIDPEACHRVLMVNEKDGGHGERSGAVGLIDAALWDARAKAERKPLWRTLADRYRIRGATEEIDVYASCGHFRPGTGLDALQNEVRHARGAGFDCIKIKLGGVSVAEDHARVAAAIDALGSGGELAVDLNGRLEPDITTDWLRAVASFPLAWIEEPVPPLDYSLLASFVKLSPVPVATGENLFSWDDARNLLRYGGLRADRDRVQMDVSLSYGLPEYLRMVGGFEAACWSRKRFWPHAGHLFAAHVVGGLALGAAEAAADAALPYGGFWDGTRAAAGKVRLSSRPGVGFEGKRNLFELLEPLA